MAKATVDKFEDKGSSYNLKGGTMIGSGGNDVMKTENSKRLLSLDALRGFDMLFIMGLSVVITSLCNAFGLGDGCWLARQMRHVAWHGFAHHDTIFPLFLFIAGVAFPFSYVKMREKGRATARISAKLIYRGLMLVLLGMIYNGLLNKGFGEVRWASVLGRIGLSWMFAAFLYVVFSCRTRIAIAVGLLFGYWAIMRFIPVPGAPAGADPWSPEWNLAAYVDRMLLPNPLGKTGADPEGILSTIPAIATAMLGMFAGEFVGGHAGTRDPADVGRAGASPIHGHGKAIAMFAAAVVMLAVGLVWSNWMPINKKLWTSTFVLVAGAYSLALFAAFYWIVDVKMWRGWTFPLRVVGMNAITIYLLQRIVDFDAISRFFLGGVAGLLPQLFGAALISLGHLAFCWLALWFLYRKNVFLKV